MNLATRIQLSLMMFLEFFIWGAWFVTLGTFLGNNLKAKRLGIAQVFSTQSWGAIIAPFIIGLIADRFLNAERILGLLQLAGAVLMYMMYRSENVGDFYPLALAYMILYMPTLALVNSVSFRQMKNPEKEFSFIRVFGTLGWITAGIIISVAAWDQRNNIAEGTLRNTFFMAAVAAALLGFFSFTLPKTPPVKNHRENKSIAQILGLDALNLLRNRNFLTFFLSSIAICIPLAFYYSNANPFLTEIVLPNPPAKMRFGFKLTIILGMLAWVVRYILFAYGNVDELTILLIIGIALHGICYDFFFVSGQIYTDHKAGEKYKSSAQGLITLATYGIGQLIGFWIAGFITEKYKLADHANNWEMIWLIPAEIAAVVMILFMLMFKNDKKTDEKLAP